MGRADGLRAAGDGPPPGASRASFVPEVRLAARAAVTALALAPVAAAAAVPFAGPAGALGAGAGTAIVGLISLVCLPLHVWAGRRGVGAVTGAAVGGLVLRLTLAVTGFAVAATVDGLSMTSLAVAVGVALAATVAAEMRLAASDPRHWWIDASKRPDAAADRPLERTTA